LEPLQSAISLEGEHVESTVSLLIQAAERGDESAADALFSSLYSELHRIAKRELARQGVPVSLGATILLHQAYIEMAPKDGTAFPDRARFMAYASRVMRGLIIDHARRRSAQKRGGQFHITSSGSDVVGEAADDRELVRIGGALDELAKDEPGAGRNRGHEILLRVHVSRDCCLERRLRTDCAATMGKGPRLSSPQDLDGSGGLTHPCPC
jgi:RNA polymerase sigma factor (TIGR02999 family)